MTWAATLEAYDQAATWFVRTVPAAKDRWEDHALGEWNVRDLVGHTSRALSTVEAYLRNPAAAIEVASTVEYFVLSSTVDPAVIAQRGRESAAALGDDPVGSVATLAERVIGRLREAGEDDLVTTPVGGMRLVDYLPTRTFELTVHTCDLAAALGLAVDVPEAAASESLSVLTRLAVRTGRAAPLLVAATGRRGLPDGFTVL
ncbi:MAG: maleylpyruvate isomerase N-terminal domain-containing protein [bacterium]|jgi:uncharacterized protein (TIGR03083 family)|nr:maleylpyruvate isomerase N-terminal domain-containing protein [bacterium]